MFSEFLICALKIGDTHTIFGIPTADLNDWMAIQNHKRYEILSTIMNRITNATFMQNLAIAYNEKQIKIVANRNSA